jgi:hypothetical protein
MCPAGMKNTPETKVQPQSKSVNQIGFTCINEKRLHRLYLLGLKGSSFPPHYLYAQSVQTVSEGSCHHGFLLGSWLSFTSLHSLRVFFPSFFSEALGKSFFKALIVKSLYKWKRIEYKETFPHSDLVPGIFVLCVFLSVPSPGITPPPCQKL